MRDPARIMPLIGALKRAWAKHPDLRLTQLIMNCSDTRSCYNMEDDALLKKIKEIYKV